MLSYALRRIALLVPVLIGLSMLVFVIGRLLPGDPAGLAAGPNASKQEVAALAAEFGMDLPVPVQYLRYVKGLAQGDWGRSLLSRLASRSISSWGWAWPSWWACRPDCSVRCIATAGWTT